jgi:predicted naringenin-chalcone synthase
VQPRIISIGTANPPERFTQEEIYNLCGYHSSKVKAIFENSDIQTRHLFLNRRNFKPTETADELNARYKEGSLEIASAAICQSVKQRQISLKEIDFLAVVSCTGYLCPGLSSHLVKRMGFRDDIQQANILGMGCGGAMPGLQRVFDYVKAHPERKAMLVAVEICSTAYFIDNSLETIVGNAICADGAASVILGNGNLSTGPEILDFETRIYTEHLEKVGFSQREGRLRIILDKDIPELAGPAAVCVVSTLLQRYNLKSGQIRHWILHSGGRKVIQRIQEDLGLSSDQVKHTQSILRNYGNMSSPTVLFVLKEVQEKESPKKGDYGVMLALGPGLSVEASLLKW